MRLLFLAVVAALMLGGCGDLLSPYALSGPQGDVAGVTDDVGGIDDDGDGSTDAHVITNDAGSQDAAGNDDDTTDDGMDGPDPCVNLRPYEDTWYALDNSGPLHVILDVENGQCIFAFEGEGAMFEGEMPLFDLPLETVGSKWTYFMDTDGPFLLQRRIFPNGTVNGERRFSR